MSSDVIDETPKICGEESEIPQESGAPAASTEEVPQKDESPEPQSSEAAEETPVASEDAPVASEEDSDAHDKGKEKEVVEDAQTADETADETTTEGEEPTDTTCPSNPTPAVVEEEEDKRDHLSVVFIGHVDAGKSTLAGNILYLTGQVDERTIEKYQEEAKNKAGSSWYLAFIMDTNEDERDKGKTVEVGRAHFDTEKRRFTVLDAPGHKNYVPNMIGGASQADVGILVISARKDEFETGFDGGGQTREHVMLAKTLGVN